MTRRESQRSPIPALCPGMSGRSPSVVASKAVPLIAAYCQFSGSVFMRAHSLAAGSVPVIGASGSAENGSRQLHWLPSSCSSRPGGRSCTATTTPKHPFEPTSKRHRGFPQRIARQASQSRRRHRHRARRETRPERLVPVRLGPPLSAAAAGGPAVSTAYRSAITSGTSENPARLSSPGRGSSAAPANALICREVGATLQQGQPI